MNKYLTIGILIFFLLILLMLPCAMMSTIDFPLKSVSVDDYWEYKTLVQKRQAPDDFITYDQIACLGKFDSFVYYYRVQINDADEYYLDYEYRLKTQNGTILTVKNYPAEYTEPPLNFGWAGAGTDKSIKWLDSTKIFVQYDQYGFPVIPEIPEFFVLGGRFAEYRYSGVTGGLVAIRTEKFVIEGDFMQIEEEDTLVARLLNYETTDKAILEIIAQVYNIDKEPRVQPLSLCLSAVFGAIVAGVGAWLVTFLVMRKKRGALMPVTAGAPAEEISTGEGMAAEETPVEEALAPPEDGSKTDDSGQS